MLVLLLACLIASCWGRRVSDFSTDRTPSFLDKSTSTRMLQGVLFSHSPFQPRRTGPCVSRVQDIKSKREKQAHVKRVPDAAMLHPILESEVTVASYSMLLSSVAMLAPLHWSATQYMDLLNAHPLITKAATAAILAIAGDALAQYRSQREISDNVGIGLTIEEMIEEFDVRRSISFAIFGAAYTGAFQNELFPFLRDLCNGESISTLLSSVGLAADKHLLAAVECTSMNQFVCIPFLYYPIYFAITGALTEVDAAAAVRRAKALFLPLWKRNLLFWLPVQFYQFSSVPAELQVPFVCVAGLVWNFILSATSNEKAEGK